MFKDFGKAKIVMNNNGHTILLHAGYNYRVKREGETSNSVEWECVLKKCKATVQTLYGKITKTSEHNHSSENRKEAVSCCVTIRINTVLNPLSLTMNRLVTTNERHNISAEVKNFSQNITF